MKYSKTILFIFILLFLLVSCKNKRLPNQEMIDLLQSTDKYEDNQENIFSPEAVLKFTDSLLVAPPADADIMEIKYRKAIALLHLGEEQKSVDVFEDILSKIPPFEFEKRISIMKDLAIAYLRLGERTNCFRNHNAESCIYPISSGGVHLDKT